MERPVRKCSGMGRLAAREVPPDDQVYAEHDGKQAASRIPPAAPPYPAAQYPCQPAPVFAPKNYHPDTHPIGRKPPISGELRGLGSILRATTMAGRAHRVRRIVWATDGPGTPLHRTQWLSPDMPCVWRELSRPANSCLLLGIVRSNWRVAACLTPCSRR